MGILKAAFASASSMSEDQWKEYFYCESIPEGLIMVRATKMTSKNSANNGSDDVISDGSIVAVADGQCAIAVSNGKVIATYTEPGEHVFKSGETPGIFGGATLKDLGKDFGRRFSFGGDAPAITQRIYYFNEKEIMGIPFKNSMGIPFRIVDEERGLDLDCTLQVSGAYSFHIINPMKIYKQMAGNIEHVYSVDYLLKQMAPEVNAIIFSAIGSCSDRKLRPSQIGTLLPEIEQRVCEMTKEKLGEVRGIELCSLAISEIHITEKDSGIVRHFQKTAVLQDPSMAAATLVEAQAEAMPLAAANPAGAAVGVAAVSSLSPAADPAPAEETRSLPKFCPECGTKVSGGKFCRECGCKF